MQRNWRHITRKSLLRLQTGEYCCVAKVIKIRLNIMVINCFLCFLYSLTHGVMVADVTMYIVHCNTLFFRRLHFNPNEDIFQRHCSRIFFFGGGGGRVTLFFSNKKASFSEFIINNNNNNHFILPN